MAQIEPQTPTAGKTTREIVVINAQYVIGGIAVQLDDLAKVNWAMVSPVGVASVIPSATVSLAGTLFIQFGTVATTTGKITEVATAFGTVTATVAVFAHGY